MSDIRIPSGITTNLSSRLLVAALLLVWQCAPMLLGQDAMTSTAVAKKPAALRAPADVSHCPDLTYADTDQGPLKLDLAMPRQGDGPFPAVVIIHAIGPAAKGREAYLPLAFELAQEGYVAVAISYRHTPDVAYPKAIEDAEAAVRWMRTHAAKYKIDSNRIAALGYSGGGALACLLGMKVPEKKAAGAQALPSSRVQAVVAFYPPSDFAQLHKDCRNGTVPFPHGFLIAAGFEAWLGGTPANVAERYAHASPITHVGKDMAPVLLLHGLEDAVVPFEQSQVFAKKIAAKKGRVTLVALSGAGHNFEEENGINAQVARESMRSFLSGHLAPRTLVALQR